MRRRSVSLLALTLALSVLAPLMLCSGQARSQTPPPATGDWVVEDETLVENETIVLRGSLVVASGGRLALVNCSLLIHSIFPGQYGIMIEEGGTLVATDTVFSNDVEGVGYYFDVYGRAQVQGCDVSGLFGMGMWLAGNAFVDVSASEMHDNALYGSAITTTGASTIRVRESLITGNLVGVVCQDNSNVTLTDSTISDNMDRGIQASDASRLTGTGCIITANGGGGVTCYGSSTTRFFQGSISGNSLDGLQFQDQSRGHLQGCRVASNSDYGITAAHDAIVDVIGCDVYSNGESGIQAQGSSALELSTNAITQNGMSGVVSFDDSSVTVDESDISGNYLDGVQAQDASQVAIAGSTLDWNANGVVCMHDSTVEIEDSRVSNSTRDGIGTNNNTRVTIRESTVASNFRFGVFSDDRADIIIDGSWISGNGDTGVQSQLDNGGRLLVDGCTVTDNELYGISASLPTNTGTKVTGTMVLRNGRHGVAVGNGASPLITDSLISDSGKYGMYVRDVSRPRVFNCTIQNSGEMDVWSGTNSHPVLINSTFDTHKIYLNDTESDVSIGWWVHAEVWDEAGRLVEGASVEVRDALGSLVHTGTTRASGRTAELPVLSEVLSLSGRTSLTPHNFTATKGNMLGASHISITENMIVSITLSMIEVIPDADGPGVVDPSSLFISFVELGDDHFVRGDIEVKVVCSRFVDVVVFRLERDGVSVLLSEVRVADRACSFRWNTTEHENGRYALVAEGLNITVNHSVEKRIDVIVDNERSSIIATLASVSVASVASVAVAAALGGGAAVRGAGGLEDAAGEYAEERFYEIDGGGITGGGARQAGMLAASAMALAALYSYVSYENLAGLAWLFASLLVGVGLAVFAMELAELVSARRHGLRSSFSLWPTGLASLLLTTLVFQLPFGSPGKTRVHTSGNRRGAGLSGLAKLLCAPALLPLFVLLMTSFDYRLGVYGGCTAVMLYFVDSLPVYPLEGRRVYEWSKGAWALVFVSSLLLLLSWQQVWLDNGIFILVGLTFLALLLITMSTRAVADAGAASAVVVEPIE